MPERVTPARGTYSGSGGWGMEVSPRRQGLVALIDHGGRIRRTGWVHRIKTLPNPAFFPRGREGGSEDIPVGAGCRSWEVGSVSDPGRGGRTHDRTSTTRGEGGNAADGCADPAPGRRAGGGPGARGAPTGDHRPAWQLRGRRRGGR